MADGVSLATGNRHAYLGARAGGRGGGQLPGQGRVQKAEAVDLARPFGQPEQGRQWHDQVSRAPLTRLPCWRQTRPRAGVAGAGAAGAGAAGAGAAIAIIVRVAAVARVAAIVGFVVVALPAEVEVVIGLATAVALGARAVTRGGLGAVLRSLGGRDPPVGR